jgi:hypothetical protein
MAQKGIAVDAPENGFYYPPSARSLRIMNPQALGGKVLQIHGTRFARIRRLIEQLL